MRQDHRGGARAVAVDRADIAAEQVQKAVELVLRVVKAAGAGPAIGAAEHGARPVPSHRRGAVPPRRGRAPRPTTPARIRRGRAAGPAPGPRSSQPRRIIGRAMRARCDTEAGMLPSSGDGSGSRGCGVISMLPAADRHRKGAPMRSCAAGRASGSSAMRVLCRGERPVRHPHRGTRRTYSAAIWRCPAARASIAAALRCRIRSRASSPISASSSALRVQSTPNSVPSVPQTMRSAP